MDTTEISIRPASENDLQRVMPIYEKAKAYMRRENNLSQWAGAYPSPEIILRDIRDGNYYVAENKNGELLMAFSFIIGDDPTYDSIEEGEWLNSSPYGTIHRIASAGIRGGMLKKCFNFCFSLIDNIRIDTHSDNKSMLRAINNLCFKKCGIIHLADGAPRIAFQKTNSQI